LHESQVAGLVLEECALIANQQREIFICRLPAEVADLAVILHKKRCHFLFRHAVIVLVSHAFCVVVDHKLANGLIEEEGEEEGSN
jgi:hypothetical protein